MSAEPPAAIGRVRLPWEAVEVLGAGLLACAASIALVTIASGVAFGFISSFQPTAPFGGGSIQIGPGIAQIVQRSTLWATPWLALIVLGAIGAAWWQVEGWESFVDDEDSPGSEPDYRVAFGHLHRAKALTSGALALLVVITAAVVAFVVSSFVLYGGSDVVASQDLYISGGAIGTVILVATGIFVSLRLRRSVDDAFDSASGDEPSELDGPSTGPIH